MVRLRRKRRVVNFSYAELERVEIKRGSDLDRPGVSIAFGLILMVVCISFIVNAGFDLDTLLISPGLLIRLLLALIFVGGLGVHAIYSALPIHPIIEIVAARDVYRYPITSVIKQGRLVDLCDRLRSRLGQKFIVSIRLPSAGS
jgi:hypothetical protein